MKMKANKGEWSELYAFLKILDEKRLFAADKNLEIIPDKFFIFQRIFRNEKNEQKIFDVIKPEIVIFDSNNKILKTIDDKSLSKKIINIFSEIKNSTETTFEIKEAEDLMNELLCRQIKAGNSNKADIEAEIYDRITATVQPLRFSVKSIVGGASTLLNAGKTTNFIFEVKDLDNNYIEEINAISTKSKVQDRLKEIYNKGGKLVFKDMARKEFAANLRKIETLKNEILKKQYALSYSDYKFKIKNFLQSTALGMVPSKIWDGFTKAHGGYIVVRNDGVVICYHLYNRDDFLSYLYENTKFDSASTKKHDYGKLYLKNNKMFFNLNLQIIFIK